MSSQDHLESYWPQQTHGLSQQKFGPDGSGAVEDHTELAHDDTQLYSPGLYKQQAGVSASGESCPVHRGGRG